MKRLLVFALLVGLVACVSAQDVFYETNPTLMWDAVTLDDQGNPFLPTDVIEYEVYLFDHSLGDVTVQPVASLTLFELTALTESVLTFPYRATWDVAVRTRHTDAGANVVYSAFGYSTVLEDTAVGPFSYVPLLIWIPLAPSALRDSGT